MNNSKFRIEWLLINLRWFLLLSAASVIGLDVMSRDAVFPQPALVLLIVGSVANLTALIALLQDALNNRIQNLLLIFDIVLTLGFIGSTPELQGQLLFVSLVPITVAALRISWLSSFLLALGVVLTYWIFKWMETDLGFSSPISTLISQFVPDLANGFVLLVAAIAIGRVGVRIKQTLIAQQKERQEKTQSALQMAHQKSRLVFELASTLSATLNYERVLEAALDVSNAGLQEFYGKQRDITQVGLILLFGMDEYLYVSKSRGLSHIEEQKRFPADEGVLAKAVNTTDPILVNQPAADPELGQLSALAPCQQAIIVPLRAGYESYGLLILGSPEPDIYTHDFRDLLVAICNQAVLALQNANLYQNLMEEKDRLVNVEEDARKKLARDLHDGPTQTIAAIAMRLNYIRLLVNENPGDAIHELSQLEELARRTTKEIRQLLFAFRPLILESQGLIAALDQVQQKVNETDPIPIHMETKSDAEDLLSDEAQGAIFYIMWEAVTNARKHANADNIWIRLYKKGMNVIGEVEDDGAGFDVAAMESNYANRGSLGMINVRERATLVGGKTIIRSSPGNGTTVRVTIPVDQPEPEKEATA
jgi:signal transduction histidine kinase